MDRPLPRRSFGMKIAAMMIAALTKPMTARGQAVAPLKIGVLASLTGRPAPMAAAIGSSFRSG